MTKETSPSFPHNRYGVLLVDDDAQARELTGFLLGLNHEVVAAPGADEALVALESTPGFDVVITDYSMPRCTGWELILRVRKQWPHLGRRFILLSGNPPPEIREAARAAGVLVLEKPASRAALLRAIDQVAAGHRRSIEAPATA